MKLKISIIEPIKYVNEMNPEIKKAGVIMAVFCAQYIFHVSSS